MNRNKILANSVLWAAAIVAAATAGAPSYLTLILLPSLSALSLLLSLPEKCSR